MSKNCANCEHRNVCEIYHNPKFKMTKCTEWSGWHNLIENPNDLPQDGMYEIASADDEGKITIGFGQYEIVYGYGGGWTATMPTIGSVIAWHEMSEYEVRK